MGQAGEFVRETSRVQMPRAWLMSCSRCGPHTSAKVELRSVLLQSWKTASSVNLEGEGGK